MSDIVFGTLYVTNGVYYVPITSVKISDGVGIYEGVLSFIPSSQEYVVLTKDFWDVNFPLITKQ